MLRHSQFGYEKSRAALISRRSFVGAALVVPISWLALMPTKSSVTGASQRCLTRPPRPRRLRVVLTHLNVEKTQDGGLFGGGSKDELEAQFYWDGQPEPYEGPSIPRCGGTLAHATIGSWGKTGTAQRIDRVLFDGPLPNEADRIILNIYDVDDTSLRDNIGGIEFSCVQTGAPELKPLANTRAFGQTIPDSWDFQMTGSGARQSYWFQVSVNAA